MRYKIEITHEEQKEGRDYGLTVYDFKMEIDEDSEFVLRVIKGIVSLMNGDKRFTNETENL